MTSRPAVYVAEPSPLALVRLARVQLAGSWPVPPAGAVPVSRYQIQLCPSCWDDVCACMGGECKCACRDEPKPATVRPVQRRPWLAA